MLPLAALCNTALNFVPAWLFCASFRFDSSRFYTFRLDPIAFDGG